MNQKLVMGFGLFIASVVGMQSFTAVASAQAAAPAAIVFASNREGGLKIYAAQRDGGNMQKLTNGTTEDKEPAVSPSGDRLAFVSADNAEDYESELVLLNLSTQERTVLTTDAKTDYRNPVWSPDGTRIAFASITAQGNYESCINVITIADRTLQKIACGSTLLMTPGWSPNGQELLFTEFYRSTGGKIYKVTLHPEATKKFIGYGFSAVFSPSGNEIAFSGYDSNFVSQIFVSEADGSLPRQITGSSEHHTVEDWAADDYITYTNFNQAHGTLQAMSIKSDGSGQLTIPQKARGIFDLPGKGLFSSR